MTNDVFEKYPDADWDALDGRMVRVLIKKTAGVRIVSLVDDEAETITVIAVEPLELDA